MKADQVDGDVDPVGVTEIAKVVASAFSHFKERRIVSVKPEDSAESIVSTSCPESFDRRNPKDVSAGEGSGIPLVFTLMSQTEKRHAAFFGLLLQDSRHFSMERQCCDS